MSLAVVPIHEHTHFEPSDSEKLGDEITELCGYIYAATYHLLELIREFDEKQYWAELGFHSCAHWLNFKCGFGMNSARERLRVAHALSGLPKISEKFSAGAISYSKVRAITRVADESNEDYLLMVATHGTAHHVERLVSQYRRAKKLQDTDFAMDLHGKREVTYYYDHDGCLVMKARIPADQGELIVKALEMAIEEDFVGARLAGDIPHVPAETSRRIACDCSKTTIKEDKNGEPLNIGRRSRTIPPPMRRALKARDSGCRFPGCTNHKFVDGHHIIHWADGGETSLDNLVLLCRHHHHLVHEGGFDCKRSKDGEIYFLDQKERNLESYPTPKDTTLEESLAWMYRKFADKDVYPKGTWTAETPAAKWYAGEQMNWDHAVSLMFPGNVNGS